MPLSISDVAALSRLLDEAICAFGAKSGAVYLSGEGVDGAPFYAYGDWKEEDTKVEVPLEYHDDHIGMLKLGARQDGSAYTAHDLERLKSNAEVVARAIEVAACSLYPSGHAHQERRPSTMHALPE